jgi:uncharacterized protein (DUF1778 family)
MAKTVTLRVEDSVYNLIKKAADGERRSISNFLEYAAINYLTSDLYVSDEEMQEMLTDKALMKSLKLGIKESQKGQYKIVG